MVLNSHDLGKDQKRPMIFLNKQISGIIKSIFQELSIIQIQREKNVDIYGKQKAIINVTINFLLESVLYC